MSRNFKDIIDEGFSQLALLADKRREILSRAEKITGDVCAAHNQAAGSKLQATESHILPEINACSEHLLQELQQTIAQVTGDNARFQSGLKDTLQTSVSLVLAQLARTRTYLLSSARERLDILLLELDTEFQADKLRLGAESTRRLSELDNWSLSSQSALRQAQSEMSLRVSLAEYKTTAQLGKTFGQIIQDAETKRQEITEYLNSLLDQQVEKLSADSTDLHSRLEPLIQEQCEKMKELCATRQQSLNHIAAQALSSAIAGLM